MDYLSAGAKKVAVVERRPLADVLLYRVFQKFVPIVNRAKHLMLL